MVWVLLVLTLVAIAVLAMRRAPLWQWALVALVVGALSRISTDNGLWLMTDTLGWVLALLPAAILALLVLAWDRASGIGADERREIAVLKAVGWSTSDVLWAKLFESILVGAGATALGLLLGYAWVFWLGAPGLRPALVGWSVLYPRASLTPVVDVAQLLGVTIAVLGPFVLLSVVPAWRAATADPLESMRS